MPDKNNKIHIFCISVIALLISFNIVFQGMAYSIHLFSHHHEHNPLSTPHFGNIHIPSMVHDHNAHENDFVPEKTRSFIGEKHKDCLICKILKDLNHTIAFNNQTYFSFTPLSFESIRHKPDDIICRYKRNYKPRAPPSVSIPA